MYSSEIEKIQNALLILKEIKSSSFYCTNGLADFHKARETCRIVDMLMLPLYYMWEYCCHQQLEDISFEEHLRKSYQKFIQNPITYTWVMYIFINLGEPLPIIFSERRICKEISFIYKKLIELFVDERRELIHLEI